jgi:hypothetical protein
MPFTELLASPRFTRTHRWAASQDEFLLGLTLSSASLYAASGDAAHFDLEGRWHRARLAHKSYLRGLDGLVLQRFAGAHREDVRTSQAEPVHASVVTLLERARPGAPAEFEPLGRWTVARLLDEGRRFLEVYRPLGVLPPDRYRSLIIQLTEGCAYNGCLFCSLYKGQPHRVKSVDELARHVRAVKDFVGSGVTDRRGVFLGEANALAAPQATLLAAFELLEAELAALVHGTGPARGVSAFVDAFEDWKSVAELTALRQRGLTRVFLGVESGDERTLAVLGKPSRAGAVRAVVERAKAAGLSVGLTVLVGLGPEHVEASGQLVASLGLDEGDVVYLSPLVLAGGGSALDRELARRGVPVPTQEALALEYTHLKAALAGERAQVARYDVRRFVYA